LVHVLGIAAASEADARSPNAGRHAHASPAAQRMKLSCVAGPLYRRTTAAGDMAALPPCRQTTVAVRRGRAGRERSERPRCGRFLLDDDSFSDWLGCAPPVHGPMRVRDEAGLLVCAFEDLHGLDTGSYAATRAGHRRPIVHDGARSASTPAHAGSGGRHRLGPPWLQRRCSGTSLRRASRRATRSEARRRRDTGRPSKA